jgi:hypothetical protein
LNERLVKSIKDFQRSLLSNRFIGINRGWDYGRISEL